MSKCILCGRAQPSEPDKDCCKTNSPVYALTMGGYEIVLCKACWRNLSYLYNYTFGDGKQ